LPNQDGTRRVTGGDLITILVAENALIHSLLEGIETFGGARVALDSFFTILWHNPFCTQKANGTRVIAA
jgi:hypothetical protein